MTAVAVDTVLQSTAAGASTSSSITLLATCPSSIAVGDLVYSTGAIIGGLQQIAKVDISNTTKMPVLGIVTIKSSPTSCTIVLGGRVSIVGLSANVRYFAGSNGRITASPPSAISLGFPILFQCVGLAIDNTHLNFQPNNLMVRLIP